MEQCDFCIELGTEPGSTRFIRLLGHEARRIVFESPNFVVLPSLGPLSAVHLMIVPREHIRAVACLSGQMWSEFAHVHALVRHAVRARTGWCCSFEHGPVVPTRRAGCCVDHAHMHVLGFAGDPTVRLPREWQWRSLGKLDEIRVQAARGVSYLFVQDDGDAMRLLDVNEALPSQLLRQAIAAELNLRDLWDWRQSPRPEEALSMARSVTCWREWRRINPALAGFEVCAPRPAACVEPLGCDAVCSVGRGRHALRLLPPFANRVRRLVTRRAGTLHWQQLRHPQP